MTMKNKLYASLIFAFGTIACWGQTVIYVKPVASGTGDGSSWLNATADLYNAIQGASSNTEIWVAQGTYLPVHCTTCTDSDRLQAFPMKDGVAIVGGFIGTETLRIEASASNTTILSGDIGTAGDNSDNSYNVVHCNNCGVNAGLENVTIEGANGNRTAANGPTERGRAGGGLYITGSLGQANPVVTNCVFQNNTVIGQGGALYGNASPGETSPFIRFTTFRDNTSNGEGGAAAFNANSGFANPKFDDCQFLNNATVYSASTGQAGGALFVACGNGVSTIDIKRSIFQNNAADASNNSGVNNNSSGNGGAMYITSTGGTLVLNAENSIFDGNTAFSAGCVYNLGGTANFKNCTVVNNTATGNSGSGGGIYVNGSTANVVNTIIYGNAATNNPFGGKDFRFVNGTVNISYSLVESTNYNELFSRASTDNTDMLTVGSGLIYGLDPQLASPAGYPEIDQATSPAINAGDNSNTVAGGDFTSLARIQQSIVDLGAVESAFAPLPVELISFDAKIQDQEVRLEWFTASEIDLEGYHLMRSIDGVDFIELAFIPAMDLGSYSYIDKGVAGGNTYYYQLLSQDFDGTTYDSKKVSAILDEVEQNELVKALYPNPTSGEIKLILEPLTTTRTMYATVLDAQGRKVRLLPITKDGEHILSLSDLANGQYFMRISSGSRTQTLQFTIQH